MELNRASAPSDSRKKKLTNADTRVGPALIEVRKVAALRKKPLLYQTRER
jgi:hypothetical protein